MHKNISILYFASLGEQLGVEEESFALEASTTVEALIKTLSARSEEWQRFLAAPTIKCAVNQNLSKPSSEIQPGDEVAFFPPVTGG